VTLTPDHWLVRRAEMLVWLGHIRDAIEDQAPESIPKQRALKQLDSWLDDLPSFCLLKN
jgi:hypothetical protein